MLRRKSVVERQLNKAIKNLKDSISVGEKLQEAEAQEKQRQQIWDAMSPRLKLRLLKYIEKERSASNKEQDFK